MPNDGHRSCVDRFRSPRISETKWGNNGITRPEVIWLDFLSTGVH